MLSDLTANETMVLSCFFFHPDHPAAPFQRELLGEHFWMGRRL